MGWKAITYTHCHKPFLWSNFLWAHYWLCFNKLLHEWAHLWADHMYTMCIMMPLLLLCEELHLINPVFLPGQNSYLNNNHIRIINKRPGGMGWRALLLLGELWVACVVIFSWFSSLQHHCLLKDLIRRLEQKLLLFHDIPAGYFYFIIFVVFLAEILPRMNFLTLMWQHLPIFQRYRDCKCWVVSV